MRGFLSAALPLLLLVGIACTSQRSLPTGVAYLSEDGTREVRALSPHELDLRAGGEQHRGRYSVDGDRVRVVFTIEGEERVFEFTLSEGGLLGEDGVLLVAVEPETAEFERIVNLGAQRETVAKMRNAGTALMAWLTDQVGAAAAGEAVSIDALPAVGADDVEEVLVPTYLNHLPRVDGWGHPFEYRVAFDDPLGARVLSIRSPGADGRFDADVYETGPFDPDLYDRDIVWTDGYFVCWPERGPR